MCEGLRASAMLGEWRARFFGNWLGRGCAAAVLPALTTRACRAYRSPSPAGPTPHSNLQPGPARANRLLLSVHSQQLHNRAIFPGWSVIDRLLA